MSCMYIMLQYSVLQGVTTSKFPVSNVTLRLLLEKFYVIVRMCTLDKCTLIKYTLTYIYLTHKIVNLCNIELSP